MDFRPAKPSAWMVGLAGLASGVVVGRHTTLDIRPRDLDMLRSLPRGCLIAPNHSHYYDGQVAFTLARRAGRRIVVMATREIFDRAGGLAGWCAQRLGIFSVNRGGANDEARAFARAVISEGTADLLMFPEGEVYLLNDLVMPLKPGVARLALEAAARRRERESDVPVVIVPVAIKYAYVGDIRPALQALLGRIEARLFGRPQTGSLYPRIVAAGAALLSRSEKRHDVPTVSGDDLFQRIERFRQTLLSRLELKHFGAVQAGADLTRARKLMIRIQGAMLARGPGGASGTPEVPVADPLARDLTAARQCARSVAFQRDYVLEHPTQERVAETIVKIEREVFGSETRTFGRRVAHVRLAPPIDASAYLPAFLDAPDRAIDAVVVRLHDTLQRELDAAVSSPNAAASSDVPM